MPSHIEEFVSEAIIGGSCFWVPGLAQLLTSRFWQNEGCAFSASTYGSERWLTSDPWGCRTVTSVIETQVSIPILIESLPEHTNQHYISLGLKLRHDVPSPEDVMLFKDALALLHRSTGLFEAVAALVRSIHLLVEIKLSYDTSHSDPRLPCSIFVSVPRGERYSALRLAESIIHEAMHLQLTMLEHEVPLVCNPNETGYSPWQRTDRPVSGLLHGLFVFSVIGQWLAQLKNEYVFRMEESMYIAKRREEITHETAMVSGLTDSRALTPFGRRFASWLLGTQP